MARLHVQTLGRGPDLVLLHGWGMASRVWRGVQDALAQRFRLHLVDLPGHGDSPAGGAGSFDGWVEAVASILPPQASVAGWSLGGQVAMGLALRFPQRIRRLVLAGTTPCFAEREDWAHGMEPRTLEEFADGLARDREQTVRRFLLLQTWGSDGARQMLGALRQAALGAAAPGPHGLERGFAMLRYNDLRQRAGAIAAPTLILHGERDVLVRPGAAQWLERALPHARLVVFPRCGHAPFLCEPVRFVREVAEFLEDGEAP